MTDIIKKHGLKHGKDFVGVGVGVIIVKNKKILLLYRSDFGEWSIPGGKVELNEKGEDTAKRELKEELGIDVKVKGFVGITEVFNPHWISLVYEADIISGEPKVMEPDVHSQVGWFDLSCVPEEHFRPSWLGIKKYAKMHGIKSNVTKAKDKGKN